MILSSRALLILPKIQVGIDQDEEDRLQSSCLGQPFEQVVEIDALLTVGKTRVLRSYSCTLCGPINFSTLYNNGQGIRRPDSDVIRSSFF